MENDSRVTSLKQRIDALRSQYSGTSIRYGQAIKREATTLIDQYGLLELSKVLGLQRKVLQQWQSIFSDQPSQASGVIPANTMKTDTIGFVALKDALGGHLETDKHDVIRVTCSQLGLEMHLSMDELGELLEQRGGVRPC